MSHLSQLRDLLMDRMIEKYPSTRMAFVSMTPVHLSAQYAVIPVLPDNSCGQYYFCSSRACKQTESSVSSH